MIPTSNAGVNYYRLATFAWQMRKHRNVQVALYSFQYNMNDPHPWQRDFLTNPIVRSEIENLCRMADVVIWQPCFYGHTLEFFMDLRAKYEKPFLIETDDNYIDVPPWNEAFHSYGPNSSVRQCAIESLKLGDGVIVSTPFLGTIYSEFNQHILTVPNSVDFKVWDQVGVTKHRYTRIGWIGGRTHVRDLMIVAPAIRRVLARHPDAWFYVINSALKPYAESQSADYVFKDVRNVYYSDKNAPINLYPRFMSSFNFDIGIAPLEDCNFNRAKSNLRWLEYSALKVPTIATNVGHFAETVQNQKDGVLVPNDIDEWEVALEAMIKHESWRRQIGNAAYKRVKADFNVRKTAAKYLRALKEIAGYGMGLTDYGGTDESEPTLHPDRGLNERPESRPILNVAD
jgi:glycosyltransferase involved in cell wall biosynthesis